MSAAEGVAVRHSSATPEHYTPAYVVEAARETLAVIDLDPFSCEAAQRTVRAAKWMGGPGYNGDGWEEPWGGRVFVNPPGGKFDGQSNQKRAWFRLEEHHRNWLVSAGIFVCFSVEMLQTTQSKTPTGARLPLDFPICYPAKRIAYTRADGKVGGSPPHSSCIILVPSRVAQGDPEMVRRFRDTFGRIGRVVMPS